MSGFMSGLILKSFYVLPVTGEIRHRYRRAGGHLAVMKKVGIIEV